VQGVSGVVVFRLGSIVIKAALAVGPWGRGAGRSMRANRESGIWVAPFSQSRQRACAALAVGYAVDAPTPILSQSFAKP